MGKEFVEYQSDSGRIPYTASTICSCLTQYAKNYIKEERTLIKDVDSKVRDAVLVDAINYLGSRGWADFGLYTKDLYDDKKHDDYVEPSALLTVLQNHFANYMFNQNLVESILRNNHMNACRKPFDVNDGALVIIDFINYIAKVNGYDRVFTIKDLYEKAKIQEHNVELLQLRDFLEATGVYSEKLINGQSISAIFREMARKHHLKCDGTIGKYHYTDDVTARTGRNEMSYYDAKDVDMEIYAMAYAYAKFKANKKTRVKVIDSKIAEMKKR